MLPCTICSEPYMIHTHDYLGVCQWCTVNFAGTLVHRQDDAMHVDEDLVRRLLTEHQAEEESYGTL